MLDARATDVLFSEWHGYFRTLARSFEGGSRYDEEDLIQECCLALLALVDEVDPSSPDFDRMLKVAVKRRLKDCHRRERRKCRDVRREVSIDEAAECLDSVPDPADEIVARDLLCRTEKALVGSNQLTVWSHLIRPDHRLGQAFSEYRETKPESQQVPTAVYAEVSGLSERQCRYALRQIREVAARVFQTERIPTCSF